MTYSCGQRISAGRISKEIECNDQAYAIKNHTNFGFQNHLVLSAKGYVFSDWSPTECAAKHLA